MGAIADIVKAVQTGQRSAEQVVRESLVRIQTLEPKLHAFISFDADRAVARAKELDADRARGRRCGLLTGVPLAVKDNICTSFSPTTCGSRILEPFHSRYDAHVVERLQVAGAVIVGKTNLDEFAMGSSTEFSAFGATRNPWDTARVPGGSSGGSVVAVAARMVPGAFGSETGGSVRQPAALCGVVGLKPSYGRVSRYGLVAFGSSLDQIGPIAADVLDLAILLGVIAGHDPRDSTCAGVPVPDYAASLNRPLKGLRVGICEEHFGAGLDADIRDAVQKAVKMMTDEGATVVPIELPHIRYGVACYYIIAPAEACSNLARFDGIHYGYRAPGVDDIIELYARSREEGFGPEVKRRIMLGTYALSSGYYDAYYLKALKVRTLMKRDFDQAFERVDVIASPVTPSTAFRIGEKTDDPVAMYLNDVYTIPANLAGVCAISVPCGFDRAGLPIGLQLTGPAFGEDKLLAAAHQYQLRTNFHLNRPPIAAAA